MCNAKKTYGCKIIHFNKVYNKFGLTEGELNLQPTAFNPPTSYNQRTRLISQLRFEISELVLEVYCSLIARRIFKEDEKVPSTIPMFER